MSDSLAEVKTRPCLICAGSGFSGFGTGYDDVCSNCIGGEVLADEPLGYYEILAVVNRRMKDWSLFETMFRTEVHLADAVAGRYSIDYGLPVACARVSGSSFWEAEVCGGIFYLLGIQVEPRHRGKGHGAALYEIITEIARELGCNEIRQMPSGWTSNERGINETRPRRDYLHDRGWTDVEAGGDVRKILKENTVNGVIGEP
jgi:GNAT superfamily N-acetyltransferase